MLSELVKNKIILVASMNIGLIFWRYKGDTRVTPCVGSSIHKPGVSS